MYEQNVTERQALENFKLRLERIAAEVGGIDRELAQRDLLSLAHRARDAIRQTRTLLDKNVEILFAGHPPQFHQDLYNHLNYAEAHVEKALSEEFDFTTMEKRIYLANKLAEGVLRYVAGAIGEMEARFDGSG